MALISTVEATWADVLRVARASTEVVAITDVDDQEFFLNSAGRRFTRVYYKDFTVEIQANAAAHLAQMSKTKPAGLGPASSESIGGVSRSNTLPANNTDESWGETIYGRAVKKLMAIMRPNIIVANPSVVML